MSDIEAQNHPEYLQAPRWMYGVFICTLLIALIFIGLHLLKAYPHFETFQSISLSLIQGLTALLIFILLVTITYDTAFKVVLMVIIIALTIFALSDRVIGGVLVWSSLVVAPLALIGLISYIVNLIIKRFSRHFFLAETTRLVIISLIFAISTVTYSWYGMIRYEIIDSHSSGNESYHLITFTGHLDYPRLSLNKCNALGILCQQLYKPDDEYDYKDIHWEVSEDNTTITIFVNDEAIHTAIITNRS